MANLITLSRLVLLFLVIVIAYHAAPVWQLINVPLLIIVFVTDGLDGYVARRRNEASLFGAIFDIAVDRVVEYSLWIVLAHLRLVPIWVPLIFVVRGSIVDAIRAEQVASRPDSPFAAITSPAGRFLVAGKFMRVFYSAWKATAFCWLCFLQPLPTLVPGLWAQWSWILQGIADLLVWGSVLLCVARGLPVIVEFTIEQFGRRLADPAR